MVRILALTRCIFCHVCMNIQSAVCTSSPFMQHPMHNTFIVCNIQCYNTFIVCNIQSTTHSLYARIFLVILPEIYCICWIHEYRVLVMMCLRGSTWIIMSVSEIRSYSLQACVTEIARAYLILEPVIQNYAEECTGTRRWKLTWCNENKSHWYEC